MFTLSFKPWRRFTAYRDKLAVRNFIEDTAETAERRLKRGMRSGKSGRVYRRRGGSHRASAAGEYPARDSGELFGSIRKRTSQREATIGTTKKYAIYLRLGTSKMARRKMSDDALKETTPITRGRMKPWARFKRG